MFIKQQLWKVISVALFFAHVLSDCGLMGQPAVSLDNSTPEGNQELSNQNKTLTPVENPTDVPDTPQAGEDYQQMETLYMAIINSLRFLPQRREVPPVTSMHNSPPAGPIHLK